MELQDAWMLSVHQRCCNIRVNTMEETSHWKPAAILTQSSLVWMSFQRQLCSTNIFPFHISCDISWHLWFCQMLIKMVYIFSVHMVHHISMSLSDSLLTALHRCHGTKKAMILENQDVARLQAVPEPDDRQWLVWSSWSGHTAWQTTADKIEIWTWL